MGQKKRASIHNNDSFFQTQIPRSKKTPDFSRKIEENSVHREEATIIVAEYPKTNCQTESQADAS